MGRIILFTLLIVLSVSLAYAHRVNIFAHVENGRVVCQCYYSDGTPVRGQQVQATTLSGTIIGEGKTDDEGIFSFSPGVREDLKIVLNAGMGHTAETTISRADLPVIKEKTISKTAEPNKSSIEKDKNTEQSNQIDEEQLRSIVEQVVDEKLRPVTELIRKQQRSHSLTTIIGGVGYIVGIFGLLMFFKSRKKA